MNRLTLLVSSLFLISACGLGSDGNSNQQVLLTQNNVEAGEQCSKGGVQLQTGIDDDGNGTLEAGEVDTSSLLCNGDKGDNGESGVAGPIGENGEKGANGLNSLIAIVEEEPGENCPFGGRRVEAGIDLNSNGVLDTEEVTQKAFVCAEHSDTFNGLVFNAGRSFVSMTELYAVEEDGRELHKVAGPFGSDGAIWNIRMSPSHHYVAYDYRGTSGESNELHIANLVKGGEPKRITDQIEVSQGNHAWSSEGDKLAYIKKTKTGERELYTISPDATGNTRLFIAPPTTYGVANFLWAPDGKSLVFSATNLDFGKADLYTVGVNGTALKRVSGDMSINKNVGSFEWSPDGEYIAFILNDATNKKTLWVVRPDGTDVVQVSQDVVSPNGIFSFKWSPDSSLLLYKTDSVPVGGYKLFSVKPDGSSHNQVSGEITWSAGVNSFYFWSPDSSAVLYRSNQDDSNLFELYVADANGDNNHKISGDLGTVNSSEYNYKWSPNGGRVVFYTNSSLYIAQADGSGVVDVIAGASILDSAWTGGGGLRWSPSGEHLYFLGKTVAMPNQEELFRVTADGSNPQRISHDLAENEFVDPNFQFTPDGQKVIYYVWYWDLGVSLHSVGVDGNEHHLLSGESTEIVVWEVFSSEYMYNDD